MTPKQLQKRLEDAHLEIENLAAEASSMGYDFKIDVSIKAGAEGFDSDELEVKKTTIKLLYGMNCED